jgi:hypothetical protein
MRNMVWRIGTRGLRAARERPARQTIIHDVREHRVHRRRQREGGAVVAEEGTIP